MTEVFCPQCGVGFVPPVVAKKRKSRPQECRFHALCAAAFQQWPEAHHFRPRTPDHMRYWLTCEAGFFDVRLNVRCQSNDPKATELLLTSVIRASTDENLFIDLDGNLITVKAAKSTAEDAMDGRQYAELNHCVDDILRAEGLNPEMLLRRVA